MSNRLAKEKRLRIVSRIVWIAALAGSIAVGFIPDLIESPEAKWITFASLLTIAGAAVAWAQLLQRRRLKFISRRGVSYIGALNDRDGDFDEVWKEAQHNLVCAGVGMTRVLEQRTRFLETVNRGVRVRLLMIDETWLQQNPNELAKLNAYYGGTDRLRAVLESAERMRQLVDGLGHTRALVDVIKIRGHVPISFTIADWNAGNPRGCVEFHLFGSSERRILMRVGSNDPNDNTEAVRAVIASMDAMLALRS